MEIDKPSQLNEVESGSLDAVTSESLGVLALEPRIVFDAAAPVAAVEFVDEVASAEPVDVDQDRSGGANALVAALEDTENVQPVNGRQEIIFIDPGVEDAQVFLNEIATSAEVIFLDPGSDGLEQISDHLKGRQNIDAIHLISHGSESQLELGNETLNFASMSEEQTATLGAIGSALSGNADILIYGCNFGAGSDGVAAARLLAEITSAEVAASDDPTGAESLGGDWDLEVSTGAIEASALAAPGWTHVLADTSDGTVSLEEQSIPGSITLSHDGGALAVTTANTPMGASEIVDRLWQYEEPGGDNGTQTIRFDVSGIGGLNPAAVQGDFGLVISKGSDLTLPANQTDVISASGYDPATDEVVFRLVNLDDGDFFTLATQRETDRISLVSNSLTTNEDTPVSLGIILDPAVTDGGQLQIVMATDVGSRPAGSTAFTEYDIPAGAEGIVITGYSTEPDDNAGLNNLRNDDYQTLHVNINLDTGLSSGSLAYILDRLTQNSDQYGFKDAPLGQSVLTGGGTITGNSDDGIDPLFEVVDGKLRITENHGLQSAYLVEFVTSENESANFLGTGTAVQNPGDTTSVIALPPEIVSGNGYLVINENGASAGSNSSEEPKGFSRIVVDLDTMLATGVIAAENGETQARTVTFAFEGFDVSSPTAGGVLAGATVTGDTTSNADVNNSPDIFIDANGLNITRSAGFAGAFTSLYTVEFYEKVDAGSIAAYVDVQTDDTLFNASASNPQDSTLAFNVPASAKLAFFHLSMNTVGGSALNENMGTGFAVVDLETGTTSGSFVNVRISTPDLVAWSDVPFGDILFDDPKTVSNHSDAGDFTDGFGATAHFDLITNPDGSRTLEFSAQSDASNSSFADYQTNGQVQFLGSEPFQITGVPVLGSLSAGSPLPNGDFEIDVTDIATLQFIPPTHFGDLNNTVSLTLELFGETEQVDILVTPVADQPVLVTQDATGLEDQPIDISGSIATDLVDQDGSESINRVELFDIPEGYIISDGTNSFTATAVANNLDITAYDQSQLTIQAPANVAETITLRVEAETTEADNGDTALVSDTFDITVEAVADTPKLGYSFENGDVISATDTNNDFVTDSFTIDLVVQRDNTTNSASLFSYAVPGSSNELLIFQSASRITLYVNGTTRFINFPADTDLHRITISADLTQTTGNVAFYLDGELAITRDLNTGPITTGGALVFGQEQDSVLGGFSSTQDLEGVLYSVNLHSTVLTAEEISQNSAGNGDVVSLDFSTLNNQQVLGDASAAISLFDRGMVQGANTIVPFEATLEDMDSLVLDLRSSICDDDGSETLVTSVSNIPVGATLSDGSGNSFTASAGNTTVDVSAWSLQNIVVTPVEHDDSDITLTVTATATESSNGATSSASSDVTFAIKAVADAPTLIASDETRLQDTAIDLSDNLGGSLVDADGSEELSYTISNIPAGAVLTVDNGSGGTTTLVPIAGAVAISEAQRSSLSFLPPPGFFGTITLDVVATATEGATGDQVDTPTADSSVEQIVLTITPLNLPPTVEPGDELPDHMAEDSGTFSLNAATAFTDPNGNNTLSYSSANLPSFLQIDATTGEITVSPTGGSIPASASQGGTGGVYTITVTATDDFGENVSDTFDLTISNPAPTAGDDTFTTDEDTNLLGNVTGGDSDPDGDTLTYSQTSAPTNGTVSFNSNGTFTYSPNADFNGMDSFTYLVSDGEGGTAPATVNITVAPVNDAPVIGAVGDQSNDDGEAIPPFTIGFSDIDGPGQTFSQTGLPSGLMINSATGEISGVVDNSASLGSPYSVTITVVDRAGGSDQVTFLWTIDNPVPTAADDTFTTDEDVAVGGTVLAGDVDPDGDDLTVDTTPVLPPASGTLSLAADGSFTYTPNANFNGTDTFTYRIRDGEGGVATAVVTINVNAINDVPTVILALPDLTNADGNSISVATASAFSDLDGDALTYSASNLPMGLAIDADTGVISGTIAINQSVTGPYSVTVTADDGNGGLVSDTFVWTITNPAPEVLNAIPDQTSSDLEAINLPIAGSFNDPDGDVLAYSASGLPDGLSINPGTGAITGSLAADASQGGPASDGIYTVSVTVDDREGGVVTDTFIWTISNVPPVLGQPLLDIVHNDAESVSVNASTAFLNPDNDTLTFTASGLPASLMIDPATGIISGTLDNSDSQFSDYTIQVIASDGEGGTATDTFLLTVNNPVPTVTAPIADQSSVDDEAVSLNAAAAFSDIDGDDLTFSAVSLPTGLVIDPSTGLISGTIDNSASLVNPFTVVVTVDDGEGGTASDTFIWTVTNPAPTVSTGIPDQTGQDFTIVALDVSSNFADVDGDNLTFAATGLPDNLTVNASTGEITGTLGADASAGGPASDGVYSVIVTVDDGEGGIVSDTFTWTVTDPPPIVVSPIPNQASVDAETVNVDTSAAFNDPDGDTLAYSATGLPLGLSIDAASGVIAGTIDNSESQNGLFTIVVTATDGTTSVTDTFDWTVTNPVPIVGVGILDQVSVDGSVVSLGAGGSFSDPDGDDLTFTAVGLPAGLTIDAASGLISGTIDNSASQFGPYSVTVTADDGEGGTVTDTFTWQVSNPAPVGVDDVNTTSEDVAVSGNVLTNDTDPDGDDLSAVTTLVNDASNGSVTLAADGAYTYTPDADFNGTDMFTYTVDDGEGGTDTTVVTITVTPVNDAPVVDSAIPDQSHADDESVSVPVAGAFSDIEGDSLSYSASGLPAGLTIDTGTGVISGTIDNSASVSAPYTVTVTANDGNGGTVSTDFVWSVSNPGPTASDDTASTTEDVAVSGNVLTNDNDPDGDTLVVVATPLVPPANGTVSISANGAYTYTPDLDFNGTDTFTYQILDNEGGVSQAVVTITVGAINDAPNVAIQIPDQDFFDDDLVSLDIAANFADLDGDTLTYSVDLLPPGLVLDSATGVISGTLATNASQSSPYVVTITAMDPLGAITSDTFTFTVLNPAPVVDTPIPDMTANDSDAFMLDGASYFADIDSDTLSYAVTGLPTGLMIDTATGEITGVLASDASIQGPTTDGRYDITITVDDGEGGTVSDTFILQVDNQSPNVSSPIGDQVDLDGDAITLDVTNNFANPDGDALTYSASGLPPGLTIDTTTGLISGTLDKDASQSAAPYTVLVTVDDGQGGVVGQSFIWTITNPAPIVPTPIDDRLGFDGEPVSIDTSSFFVDPDGDTLTFSATGLPDGLTFDPVTGLLSGVIDNSASLASPHTVSITADDGQGGTVTDTFQWTIANIPPTADDLVIASVEDGVVSGTLVPLINDPDLDDLTTTLFTPPTNGTVVVNGDGTFTYTPDADFFGTDSFVYQVDDGEGGLATGIITFNIAEQNDAPVTNATLPDVALDDAQSGVSIPTASVFSDVDMDTLTYSAANLPDGLTINTTTGQITGTVDGSASVTGSYPVIITADDGRGGTVTAPFTITVSNVPPVSVNDTATVDEDASVDIDVLANDQNPDGDTLTITAASAPNGTVTINANGTLTYQPNPDYNSLVGGNDTITYTITDNEGGTSTAIVDVTINPINDPPITTGTLPDFDVLDADPFALSTATLFSDTDNDTLVFAATGLPLGLSIDSATGEITGTIDNSASLGGPNGDGQYPITIIVDDQNGGTTDLSFNINVTNPVPIVGVGILDQVSVDGSVVSLGAGGSFSDPDGDDLTFTAVGLPAGLTIDAASGLISGTIDNSASQFGPYSVTVTADDGEGGTVTDTFTWQVSNPAPVGVDDVNTTSEDVAVSGNVLTNDTDPDGDDLSAVTTLVNDASNGSVTLAADGAYTYTPDADFNGTDMFTYTVDDGEGGTDTTVVTITVTPVNDAPVVDSAIPDQSHADDESVSVPVAGAFSDIEGDSLSYSASGLPAGLTIDTGTGVISGTIDNSASVSAPYTVTVTANDGNGGTVSTDFVWSVSNPGPTASDDTASTTEDVAVSGNVLTNDNDPDGDTLVVVATPLVPPANGTVSISANGAYTYTPDLDFNGTDTFTYQILDNEGGVSQAVVTITVGAINDAPNVAIQIPDQDFFDDDLVSLDIAANFADLDGDTLTYSVDLLPPGLVLDSATGVISGTLATNASQSSPYVVTITAMDPLGAITSDTFTFTVLNPAPVVDTPIPDMTANDSDAFMLDGASYFADIDSDTLSYAVTGLPTGLMIDTATGEITGVLASDASIQGPTTDGRYDITITVDDGEGGTVSDTFILQVDNQSPNVSSPIGDQVDLDGDAITLDVTNNFANPDGDALTYSASGLPPGLTIDTTTGLISGTLDKDASQSAAPYTVLVTVDDGQGGVVGQSFIWTITNPAPIVPTPIDDRLGFDGEPVSIDTSSFFVDPDGDTLTFSATGLPDGLTFDPVTGLLSGVIDNSASLASPHTVSITADDGQGGTVTDTFQWTIANIPPTADDLVIASVEDGVVSGTLVPLINDPDLDDLTTTLFTPPTNGTVVVNGDGTFTYTPDADFFGTDSFVYQVDDGEGGLATGIITFNIAEQNDAPVTNATLPDVALDDAQSGVSIPTASVFSDVDMDTLTYSAANLPDGLTINTTTGQITGTVDGSASVTGSYPVIITADDGRGGTVTAPFTITVSNVPPVSVNDTATVDEDASVDIDVLANDQNPDGDTLTITAASAPNGTVTINANGTLTYQPNPDYNSLVGGNDTITYTITDNEGGTSTAIVDVTINPINDPPITTGTLPDVTFTEGDQVDIPTSGVFDDIDIGDVLTFSATGLPPDIEIDPVTGLLSGVLPLNSSGNGPYTVVITADDGNGGTVSIVFTFNVSLSVQANFEDLLPDDGAPFDLQPDTFGSDPANLFGDPYNGHVIEAANDISTLGALGDLAVDHPVSSVIEEIDRLRELTIAATENYGSGFGLWEPQSITGFSLRSDIVSLENIDSQTSIGQLVVEGFVFERVLYIQITDALPASSEFNIISYAITMADGSELPKWIDQSPQGLLLIHRPVNVEQLELKIEAQLEDGRVIQKTISVDAVSAEITLANTQSAIRSPISIETASGSFSTLAIAESNDLNNQRLFDALLS